MNKAAQALGRLARGKPKHYSATEKKIRRERMVAVRAKRWPPKLKPTGNAHLGQAAGHCDERWM